MLSFPGDTSGVHAHVSAPRCEGRSSASGSGATSELAMSLSTSSLDCFCFFSAISDTLGSSGPPSGLVALASAASSLASRNSRMFASKCFASSLSVFTPASFAFLSMKKVSRVMS